MNFIFPPQKILFSPHPQYFRMCLYLELGFLQRESHENEVFNVSSHLTRIPCPCKKEKLEKETDTWKEEHVKWHHEQRAIYEARSMGWNWFWLHSPQKEPILLTAWLWFQTPELWDSKFLLLKSPSLWHFIKETITN